MHPTLATNWLPINGETMSDGITTTADSLMGKHAE